MKKSFIPLLICCLLSLGLTFRIPEDLGTLDWGNGEVAPLVIEQLMEGLTTLDESGRAVAALASRWSADRRYVTYTFFLRPGALWSDGAPVCAQQFVDAWQRVRSPELASPYAHYLHDLEAARAEGCGKLVVRLKHPAAYFPALASHWVLAPVRLDLIRRFGPRWTEPANLAVTGPYQLKEWTRDKELVLERNPRYHGAPALEPELRAVVVGDDATALSLFRAGKLDWMRDLPFLDKPALSKEPGFRAFDSFVEYHLGFRFGAGARLDRAARCALALAIDKAEIPALLKGGETPADRLVPPGLSAGAPATAPAFDARRARELWSRSPAHGRPLELHYYAKDIHETLVQWLQEQWRKTLGADVRLVKSEGKVYWSRLASDPPPLFLSGTTAAYAHPYAFLSEFLSESRANWGHFASKQYNELASRAAGLPAVRTEASVKAQKILLGDECAAIPLYFRKTASLAAPGVRNLVINPMTYTYLRSVQKKSTK